MCGMRGQNSTGGMPGETAAEYIKNQSGGQTGIQDGEIFSMCLLEGEAGHQDAISRTD